MGQAERNRNVRLNALIAFLRIRDQHSQRGSVTEAPMISAPSTRFSGPSAFLLTILLLLPALLTTGCGSGGSSPVVPPKLSGNTSVTVMLSSTGNDQLSEFDLGFTSITLTSQSGNTATLLPTSAPGSGPGAE